LNIYGKAFSTFMNPSKPKQTFFYRNSLSIVFTTLFVLTLVAQAVTGWYENNAERKQDKVEPIDFKTYLQSGHFISSTFENFESEFLQMALYVILTINLRQIGSAESKSLDEPEDVDKEPEPHKDAPWAVKKGGWILKIYEGSLSLTFILLFLVSWYFHLYGSWLDHNDQNAINNQPLDSMTDYLMQANFWFESFQNWQSEFLSIASIVVFTIFLRQKGSPESKPVDAPNMKTGK
jgi:hypothetical protein